ncbi:glycosyl hydrolase-related protein [Robinsoniella sp. KNHs210]|uniref:glycosyl hydrolase-related protein n=1 Tax=Robinsoniella sp. KNHs210 TaxID=1469950 RepID=UPI0004885158|nr:DUF5054 domain-containing protein [Robinsoniella sp. KNHs210]
MECKKIIIVFKTHFDIGFTDLAQNVLKYYSQELMPTVVDACKTAREKEPDLPYVWTMSSWPLKKILESELTKKETLQNAEKLIQRDELVWHMLPYTTHTEFCGVEEYIRGMYYGKRLCDKYGKKFISAKMTDVPGHTRALSGILNKADIKFLHLGCNPGSMPPDVPRLFYWQAPDESRVLTFYNKGGYGSSILPPEDWEFPIWLAVMQTNDNLGPHRVEAIAAFIREAKEVYPNVEVKIGTLDDFYVELMKYPTDQIPTINEDMSDSWIHGIGSYPLEVGRIRYARHLIDETQKLTSLCRDDTICSKEILEQCYENSLLFGEHTWGLDVKSTLGHDRWYHKNEFQLHLLDEACRKMEESWQEQRDREELCTQIIQRFAGEQAKRLADSIATEQPHITIFNGLGFIRNEWVELPEMKDIEGNITLIEPITKKSFAVKVVDGIRKAWITNIPALGYMTLFVARQEAEDITDRTRDKEVTFDEATGVFENQFYKIIFDKSLGTIQSLINKKTGKEWVDPKSDGLCQFQYDVFGSEDITEYIRSYTYRFYDWLVNDLGKMEYPEQKHEKYLIKEASFSEENLGNGRKVVITCQNQMDSYQKYGNSYQVIMEVSLYGSEDMIDITVSLPDKQATPFAESGSILFPFAAKDARVTMNKMGQVVDIEKEIVKDANHAMYCCENWINVEEKEDCVTLICKESPLNSVGENGIYQFHREYQNAKPVVYNNLFNNMWGTNFPQWMGGTLRYNYRLVFGKKTSAEKFRSAYTFTSPMIMEYSEGGKVAGDFPVRNEFLIKGEDIHVLTMKKAEKEKGTILRFIDIGGEKRSEKLQFAQIYNEIWECNCLEAAKECIGVNTQFIEISLGPYEIKTILLKD